MVNHMAGTCVYPGMRCGIDDSNRNQDPAPWSSMAGIIAGWRLKIREQDDDKNLSAAKSVSYTRLKHFTGMNS